MEFIKKALAPEGAADRSIRDAVAAMLETIESGGEAAALALAEALDGWSGDVVLSDEKRAALIAQVPAQVRAENKVAPKLVMLASMSLLFLRV